MQTSSHGTHILSLDVAAQTTSPSTVSQHVSTQMGSRSASSFSVDMFLQTPVRSTVLHDVATQLPLTEFFSGCIYSNNPLDLRDSVRQSPPSMQGSHAWLQPPPGLEQPGRLSVPPLWERTLYAQPPAPKEVLVPPLREPTILLFLILVQEQVPSLNHGHWFFPWSNLGNPSLTGLVTLTMLTAISCNINSAFPFFSGIQARRAEILPTLSLLPAESFRGYSSRS